MRPLAFWAILFIGIFLGAVYVKVFSVEFIASVSAFSGIVCFVLDVISKKIAE